MTERIAIDDALPQARRIAAAIVAGEIAAYEGGMRVWKEVIDRLAQRCPDQLWPFKANASAIEDTRWNAGNGGHDNPALIAQCEQEIIAAARQLLTEETTDD